MSTETLSEKPAFLAEAQEAVKRPEVQTMLRELAKLGLGVFVPHYHPPSGGMSPLPRDLVSLESGLQVSFVERDDPRASEAGVEDIGWVWDDSSQSAMKCRKCLMVGCYH